jgi:hypothetical protein
MTQEIVQIQHYTEEGLDDILREGREAYLRIRNNQTHRDWRAIGRVLDHITLGVMNRLGRTSYDLDEGDSQIERWANRLFRDWESSFSDTAPLSRQELSYLRRMMRPDVDEWYQSLPEKVRRRLNHPQAIVNKWRRSLEPRPPRPDVDAPQESWIADLNSAITQMLWMDRTKRERLAASMRHQAVTQALLLGNDDPCAECKAEIEELKARLKIYEDFFENQAWLDW